MPNLTVDELLAVIDEIREPAELCEYAAAAAAKELAENWRASFRDGHNTAQIVQHDTERVCALLRQWAEAVTRAEEPAA